MPKMSSTDATIHAVQDLIIALQNPSPSRPLVTVINVHKEALIYLANIFGKAAPSAVPQRVPINEAYPEKLQQVNQEENKIKNPYQLKRLFTHAEPLRIPIKNSHT